MYEIFWEQLNGFVPNSHGRSVWSLAWRDEFEGQRSRSLEAKMAFFGPFCGLHAVHVW